jgi:hypothetical protein
VKNKDETNELVAEKLRSLLLKNNQDNQHQEERESI